MTAYTTIEGRAVATVPLNQIIRVFHIMVFDSIIAHGTSNVKGVVGDFMDTIIHSLDMMSKTVKSMQISPLSDADYKECQEYTTRQIIDRVIKEGMSGIESPLHRCHTIIFNTTVK